MEENYEIIYAYVRDPNSSVFKSSAKDKESCDTIECNNFKNCGLYLRGECSFLSAFGWQKCPYGKFHKEEGYTKKAAAYSKWINDRKEKYKDITYKLSSHKNVMAIVGDYVFLPYSHITMNEYVPFLAKGGFLAKENCFLKKEHFTIDNIIGICEFRPYAMMGGEITSYQNEVVPKFIKHLSEVMPNVYDELCKVYEKAKEINLEFTNIGRKASLYTITPNVGKLVDCHKAEWKWDGEYLTSYNSKASFMLVNNFLEIRVKPAGNCEILITDEGQVNDHTKFLS